MRRGILAAALLFLTLTTVHADVAPLPPHAVRAAPADEGGGIQEWCAELLMRAQGLFLPAIAVGCGYLGLRFFGGMVIQGRATTDPEKLAASDPWLSRRLKELGKSATECYPPEPPDE